MTVFGEEGGVEEEPKEEVGGARRVHWGEEGVMGGGRGLVGGGRGERDWEGGGEEEEVGMGEEGGLGAGEDPLSSEMEDLVREKRLRGVLELSEEIDNF